MLCLVARREGRIGRLRGFASSCLGVRQIREYLNLAIVTGFCLWSLVTYLQRNNPNVPNIAGKLAEPSQRELGTARRFWRAALTVRSGRGTKRNA